MIILHSSCHFVSIAHKSYIITFYTLQGIHIHMILLDYLVGKIKSKGEDYMSKWWSSLLLGLTLKANRQQDTHCLLFSLQFAKRKRSMIHDPLLVIFNTWLNHKNNNLKRNKKNVLLLYLHNFHFFAYSSNHCDWFVYKVQLHSSKYISKVLITHLV